MAKKNIGAKSENKLGNDLILLLPVLFITTLFLFCVRCRIVPTGYDGFFWYAEGEYTGDLYAYFRMQVFTVLTAVFAAYMIFLLATGNVKLYKHKVYIPMIVYVVMVIVSYLLSEYKNIALFGAIGKYEGTLTLICYMLILFYTMHAIRSENSVKLVLKCFGIACLVLGLWGILQVTGMRLDQLPEALYIPASMRGYVDPFQDMQTTAVNWFFTNQNYASFFLIFPVCLFGMACIGTEDKKKKILWAALTGLMLFCLWQASSLGGMVGLAASVVAALLIAGGKNIAKWGKSLGILALAAVVSIGASLPVIMGEVKSGVGQNELTVEGDLQFAKIDHIITDGADIVFSFAGEEIRIETEKDELKEVQENPYLQASAYTDVGTGYTIIEAKTANKTWPFAVVDGQTYFVSEAGEPILLDKVDSMGFENSQEFATNRGYIWSRTLPLVKETVLFGKGADTFAIYFPQNDYAGKYNIGYYTDDYNAQYDKPHNMYLGWAVNTGVISMVAMIVVFLLYLAESVKVYRKHTYEGVMDHIGMGIFIAVVGFMVSGLVNDTTIQMMPLVYVFMGMGFAINRMLKNSAEK